jgi:hypothetical protein
MSSPVSRGFRHLRRPSADQEGRVPPGQYVTQGFPVLSAGPTPHTPLPEWTFSIRQGGESLRSWTWQEFQTLPAETVMADIHCVTRWTKLDTVWRGVPVGTLLDQVEHDASYVLAFCDGGYTSNLPAKDVTGGQAWVAFEYDGQRAGGARLAGPPGWPASRRPADRRGRLYGRTVLLLRRDRPGRRDGRLPTRTGDRGPLPDLLGRAHGHLQDPRRELRRRPRP